MIDVGVILSIIAIFLTIPTGAPILAGILLHYFYTPDIIVHLREGPDEIDKIHPGLFGENNTEFSPRVYISNQSDRDITIHAKFIIKETEGGKTRIIKDTNWGDVELHHTKNMEPMAESEELKLRSDTGWHYKFPIYPKDIEHEGIYEIVIAPKISLKEFGFPGFFREIDLQPISEEFGIVEAE